MSKLNNLIAKYEKQHQDILMLRGMIDGYRQDPKSKGQLELLEAFIEDLKTLRK